jgi:hypothetical protein
MNHTLYLRNFVLVLAMAATPAIAGAQAVPPPIVMVQAPPSNDMVQANLRLQQRLATATATNPPLLTNGDAPLVRQAFDRDGLRVMPLDLRQLGGTCGAIGRTLIAYMQFAARVTGSKDRAAVDRQAMKTQDEVSLGLASGNICVQRSFRAAEVLMQGSAPDRPDQAREGLRQMRQGAAQAIRGSLEATLSPGISAKNRDIVLSAITEDAPAVAASFPQAERTALRDMVLGQVPKATGSDRLMLQAIARAFGATACNVLCKFAGTN